MADDLTASDDAIAEALEKSDGFQLMARALPDALLVLRPDGTVVYASVQSADVLGVPTDDVVGSLFLDLVLEADRKAFPSPLAEASVGAWDFRPAGRDGGPWLNAAFLHPSLQEFRGTTLDAALGDCTLVLVRELPQDGEVRDRTDLLRRALDATNNLIVVTDATVPDNPLTVVNEHFLRTTGYTREEVIGQNCRFLQDRPDGTRDDDQRAVRELAQAVKEGRAAHVVLRNYRKDGEMFFNELFITPVRDRAGRLVNFIGVQNDVTNRIRAEREAVSQAGLLRAFFDSSPLLMGVVQRDDAGLLHRTANAHATEIFGVEEGAVAGARSGELGFSRAESQRWRQAVEACRESGEPVQFETRHPWDSDPDGEGARTFTVTVSRVSGQDDVDRDELYSYTGEDVTASRRNEREREVLAAAVEQAAESVVVTDASDDPRILYANRAHVELFGYPFDEVVGQTPRMFQGPKTDRAVLDRIRAALEAGEPVGAEAVNYRKDGTEFVLEWEIAPVRQSSGEIGYWVGTQRDVTDQRALEREVLEAATREQERMARDLHDGLGQVLVGASFRLQATRTSLDRPGVTLEAVAADLKRTQDLVVGALSQARAIARGLSPVDVAQGGLVSALEQLAADAQDAYGIACSFHARGDLENVAGADGHLYRIVQEALSNAVRHGRAESVAVALIENDGHATLTVRDDGVGMPTNASDGEGLGLKTMAYRARRLGGVLDVRAVEGGGTEVAVRIPMPEEPESPSRASAP